MSGGEVVVVGGGINGLAAAVKLQQSGHAVTLLERRSEWGGVLAQLPGTGAFEGTRRPVGLPWFGSLQHSVRKELGLRSTAVAEAAGANEVAVCIGGQVHRATNNRDRLLNEVRRTSERDASRLPALLDQLQRFAQMLEQVLRFPIPTQTRVRSGEAFEALKLGWKLRGLGEMELAELLRIMAQPAQDFMDDCLQSEWLRSWLVAPATSLSALGPRSAGSAARILLQQVFGQIPAGLMNNGTAGAAGSLTAALVEAAVSAGVRMETGSEVEAILQSNGRTDGVQLVGGNRVPAPTVLSCVDVKQTLLRWVGAASLPMQAVHEAKSFRMPGQAAQVLLRVDRVPAFLEREGFPTAAHAWIGEGLRHLEQSHDASKYNELAEPPVLTLSVPGILDPGCAPLGQYVVSVLVESVPTQGDDSLRDRILAQVTSILSAYDGKIADSVQASEVLLPADLESQLGVTGGHLMQGDWTLDQGPFMRPWPSAAHHRMPVEGLYLGGASAHPGGPSGGHSGLSAATRILSDRKAR